MKVLQIMLMGIYVLYIASAPFVYLFIQPSKELVGILILSGVLLAVLSRFHDVTELGVLGISAKIQRTINEAHATLTQVRTLAKIFANSSLSNTARSGWLGGIPEEQKLEILQSTEKGLQNLGLDIKEIQEATLDFHHCNLLEFRNTLLGGGSSQVPNLKAQALAKVNVAGCRQEWSELRNSPESPPVHPDKLMDFFEKYNFLTGDNKRRLEDYRHYYERHEFRDFEDFKSRKKWPILELQQPPG